MKAPDEPDEFEDEEEPEEDEPLPVPPPPAPPPAPLEPEPDEEPEDDYEEEAPVVEVPALTSEPTAPATVRMVPFVGAVMTVALTAVCALFTAA